MQRDLDDISRRKVDLLVVGGGIYGAWTALDAAQRGLSVALIEQGDFCSATSANHHKIIHGGLRYLQHGDLRRMRESIRERSILLRNAPGFVRPMPVLVPTARNWSRHRLLLGGALLVNDVISAGRNRGMPDDRRIPAGRLLSQPQCAAMAPGLDLTDTTGGALFFDAQVLSPERLVLTILMRAAESGASVANYVRATGYIREGDRITGITARDVLSGSDLTIHARLVMNCVGPWLAEQAEEVRRGTTPEFDVFKAAVLVVRDLGLTSGIAIPGRRPYADNAEVLRKNYRNYFITPWRGLSLIGTFYTPHWGPASGCQVTEEEIAAWLGDINIACPSLQLGRQDVYRVLAGLLPRGRGGTADELQYVKRYRIVDHGHTDGVEGLVSVMGVKFTTARGVAERAVDLAAARLEASCGRCRTNRTVLECSPAISLDAARASAELHADRAALRGTVIRAVREEMACTIADVVRRRTDLGAVGPPSDECLAECASILGDELGWGLNRRTREAQAARSLLSEGGIVNAA
jgi:glycerol-3-phosphate dehydrogenase